jgi:hypothetical protein
MQTLCLTVKGVISIVYYVTHLRKDLLKEQALRVLRIKYYSPNNLRVRYLAKYAKDVMLKE